MGSERDGKIDVMDTGGSAGSWKSVELNEYQLHQNPRSPLYNVENRQSIPRPRDFSKLLAIVPPPGHRLRFGDWV